MIVSQIAVGNRAARESPGQRAMVSAVAATGNVISGFHMQERCVAAAPGVERKANTIEGNDCKNR